jgi:hypothetical protein
MTKEEQSKKIELANQILISIRETLEQIREANKEELED